MYNGALGWAPVHKKQLPNQGCIIFSHLMPFITAHGLNGLKFIRDEVSNSLKMVPRCSGRIWQVRQFAFDVAG